MFSLSEQKLWCQSLLLDSVVSYYELCAWGPASRQRITDLMRRLAEHSRHFGKLMWQKRVIKLHSVLCLQHSPSNLTPILVRRRAPRFGDLFKDLHETLFSTQISITFYLFIYYGRSLNRFLMMFDFSRSSTFVVILHQLILRSVYCKKNQTKKTFVILSFKVNAWAFSMWWNAATVLQFWGNIPENIFCCIFTLYSLWTVS